MKLSFDYYHNLEDIEFYLCNPDRRELFDIVGVNRELTLRFNDLSTLTFDYYSTMTNSSGEIVHIDAYEYVETKRLIYATGIGWFQITNVTEHDNGVVKYKSVSCESYQSVLKNKGFISEERVYCFYNPNDPYDTRYNPEDDSSIPSVMGQLYQQLGIQQDLQQGLSEPSEEYDDWTITYINDSLIFTGAEGTCRTFTEKTDAYGYEWINNDVREAFGVAIIFDFMYKTIHVKLPSEVTEKSSVILSFSNFMKNIEVEENAEDIVTILNCNGENCDITGVNPTGTNYICDFTYYMDDVKHRWMSDDLINGLKQWQIDVEADKPEYERLVLELRNTLFEQSKYKATETESALHANMLNTTVGQYYASDTQTTDLTGDVIVETVKVGNKSIDSASSYKNTAFSGSTTITAYKDQPRYVNGSWVFSGESKRGTADYLCRADISLLDNVPKPQYLYFSDGDSTSYCMLDAKALLKSKGYATFSLIPAPSANNVNSAYYISDSFTTTAAFKEGPGIQLPAGTTIAIIVDNNKYYYTYTDVFLFKCDGYRRHIAFNSKHNGVPDVVKWHNIQEAQVTSVRASIDSLQTRIDAIYKSMQDISSRLNILSYFAKTPALLRELNSYWIEGSYANDNIAVLEDTTPEEGIDLANELMSSGRIELEKVSRPRLSFTVDAINATRLYEFKDQMRDMVLGKIITVEKDDGVWYYPALLEIKIGLDSPDDFSMSFANATRLDDWGYTYADLISEASSVSRQVSANWQNITAFSKKETELEGLIKNPLSHTLRAAFANGVNQDFIVNDSGILGRKTTSEGSGFDDEQMRIINNLIIFTDDGWETARTALGKIYYTDPITGQQKTSYGLIADTIIGSLVMSEAMNIKNDNNSILLDGNGIAIHDLEGNTVFEATTGGVLTIGHVPSNIASKSDIEGSKNLLVGTYSPSTSASSRIKIYGQTTNSTYTGVLSTVEHGLRIRVGSATSYPMYRMGSYQIASGSMNGLVAGKTYTISADISYKVISNAPSSTSVSVGFLQYNNNSSNTGFVLNEAGGGRGYVSVVPGVEVRHQKYSTTFTIPAAATSVYLIFRCSNATMSNYDADDYIEFDNIVLTEGSTPATWTTPPKDLAYGKDVYYPGSTKINGGNIETGTVTADSLNVNSIDADGCVTVKDTNGNVVFKAGNGSVSMAGWNVNNKSMGIGTLGSANSMWFIRGGTSGEASIGGSGNRTDWAIAVADKFGVTSAGSVFASDIRVGLESTAGWTLTIDKGTSSTPWIKTTYKTGTTTYDGFIVDGAGSVKCCGIRPMVNGAYSETSERTTAGYNCGSADARWGQVFAAKSTITTSDETQKTEMQDIDEVYERVFDELQAKQFKYVDGDRIHFGFGAQTVESILVDNGLTSDDFAPLCRDDIEDEDGNINRVYGLRYGEFIALCVDEIQKLKKRVKELENSNG